MTRELGYSYLWVDSLCICQDNGEHNGGEIAYMHGIYGNSEITIVAANSKSANEGFLKDLDQRHDMVEPFQITFFAQDRPLERAWLGYRKAYEPHLDPINSRAWTLQERISSRRSLIYSSSGLRWSCQTCEKSTSSPPDTLMFPGTRLPENAQVSDRSDEFLLSVRATWLKLRADYSRRRLTNDDDKLRAVSAIFGRIIALTGWRCVAGMFLDTLFLDLHWRQSGKFCQRPAPVPRAPSWSWASINSPVEDTNDIRRPPIPFHFRILWEREQHWKTLDSANPFYQEYQRGAIIVEARVITLGWGWDASSVFSTGDILLCNPDSRELWAKGTLDTFSIDLRPDSVIFCMSMSLHANDLVQGLMLLRTSWGSGTFERIGFCEFQMSGIFDSITPSILHIE
jgi:hypothetical protein